MTAAELYKARCAKYKLRRMEVAAIDKIAATNYRARDSNPSGAKIRRAALTKVKGETTYGLIAKLGLTEARSVLITERAVTKQLQAERRAWTENPELADALRRSGE